MTSQTKFDTAIARAKERAKHTDFDQHVIQNFTGEFVVIDEGDGDMPQWLVDQIIHSVTGKACLDQKTGPCLTPARQHDWFSFSEEPELPY